MAYYISDPTTYQDEYKGVTVSIKAEDHGPFDTIADAVNYWIDYNGGSVGLYASSINLYQKT